MAVAERFGVQSIPTVLILREGKEVERLDGLITDGDLKAAFERTIRP
jgi:thioredoxin-like negative regulator of GroEL